MAEVEFLRGGVTPGMEVQGGGGQAGKKNVDSGLPRIDIRVKSADDLAKPERRKEIITQILSAESTRRKAEYKKRQECYTDRTKQHTLQLIAKEFERTSYMELENRCPNLSISKKVVQKKARVYLDKPQRLIVGAEPTKAKDDPKQAALDKLTRLIGLDRFMKKVNRYLELHRNVLVSILPRQNYQEPGPTQKFDLTLNAYHPELYDIVADEQTGLVPLVVIFSYFTQAQTDIGRADYRTGAGTFASSDVAGPSQAKSNEPNQHFIFWTDKYHFTCNKAGEVIGGPKDVDGATGLPLNPLKRLPFVSFAKDQGPTFWSEGGEDLTDGAILINLLLADMYFTAKFQGTGIITATGKDIPESFDIGPNRVVRLLHKDKDDPEPKLQVVNTNAPIEQHMGMIEQLLAFILSMNDLEPGSVHGKLEGAHGAASGIQEIIQKSEITTSIEDEQEIFRDREPQIVSVLFAWIKLYGTMGILSEKFAAFKSESAPEYDLTFSETQPYVSEKERIDTMTAKKKSGLYLLRELLAEIHPDFSEDQIKKLIEELDKEKPEPPAAFGVPTNPAEGGLPKPKPKPGVQDGGGE